MFDSNKLAKKFENKGKFMENLKEIETIQNKKQINNQTYLFSLILWNERKLLRNLEIYLFLCKGQLNETTAIKCWIHVSKLPKINKKDNSERE